MAGGWVQVEVLKQQLEKEQRRATAAELALAKGHHLQRLLQAAVHTVLQARAPSQVLILNPVGCCAHCAASQSPLAGAQPES